MHPIVLSIVQVLEVMGRDVEKLGGHSCATVCTPPLTLSSALCCTGSLVPAAGVLMLQEAHARPPEAEAPSVLDASTPSASVTLMAWCDVWAQERARWGRILEALRLVPRQEEALLALRKQHLSKLKQIYHQRQSLNMQVRRGSTTPPALLQGPTAATASASNSASAAASPWRQRISDAPVVGSECWRRLCRQWA
jgi:hypothetical protein